jgi:hypothetical protein
VSHNSDSCWQDLEHDDVVQLVPTLEKFGQHVDHLEIANFRFQMLEAQADRKIWHEES